MPLDLVGKLHRTVYVEGCSPTVREDLLKLLVTKCGAIEGWDAIGVRLIIIFCSVNSISTAITFNGTAFGDMASRLILWIATESPPAGVAQQVAITDRGDGAGGSGAAPRSAEELKSAREAREKRLAAIRSELATETDCVGCVDSVDAKMRELCVRQLRALCTLTRHALSEAENSLEESNTHLHASQQLLESLREKQQQQHLGAKEQTWEAEADLTKMKSEEKQEEKPVCPPSEQPIANAISPAAPIACSAVEDGQDDVTRRVEAMVAAAEDIGKWRLRSRAPRFMRNCALEGSQLVRPAVSAALYRSLRSNSSAFTSTDRGNMLSSDGAASRTGMYGTRGYDFLQGFRALGSSAALGRLKLRLSLRALLGFAVVSGTVWYLTSRSYLLTTDPDPRLDNRCRHFSSDYAVLRNRWTGKRHVMTLTRDGESAFVGQYIRVNWLIYSVCLYLHPTESVVVVDTAPELSADRFVVKRGHRPPLFLPHPAAAVEDATSAIVEDVDGGAPTMRLLFRSQLRPARVRNCYQRGSLSLYEQTLETVVRELLADRHQKALLSRVPAGIHQILANELLQNGRLNGKNVAWKDVLGDEAEFAAEVQKRVQERLGDQVVLLHSTMTVLGASETNQGGAGLLQ